MQTREPRIDRLDVAAFKIPTSSPEADGTLSWNETTIVIVQAEACGETGLGYTYADAATAALIEQNLRNIVIGRNSLNTAGLWNAMIVAIRNLGRRGVCSMAIAAVDIALFDLKARILQLPLTTMLGAARQSIPAYGSGGFTSYSNAQLAQQLECWVSEGISAVKMKIGSDVSADLARVRAAREAIGETPALFVDANGAYSRKQALQKAEEFREFGVTWFEEPVSSDDLEGLRLMRDRGPAGMEIAAGEYGYDAYYFRRMLEAGAVDVLQADATRCAGVTGFLQADALCSAFGVLLSAHTAPSVHAHLCCAAQCARNVEYFHDHVRIEQMIFDGAAKATGGLLRPNLSRAGLGLELKFPELEQFQIYGHLAPQHA